MKHICCSDKPVLALALTRIGVGLFFALFGAMKLFVMGPDAFMNGMIIKAVGLSGTAAVIATWAVILTELVGGIFVLLGKLVPRMLYYFSLLGFAIITVVGYITVYGGDQKQLLWHGMLLFILVGLMMAAPRCPMGLTGKSCCSTGSCSD